MQNNIQVLHIVLLAVVASPKHWSQGVILLYKVIYRAHMKETSNKNQELQHLGAGIEVHGLCLALQQSYI